MARKEPRQANNSAKAKAAREAQMREKIGHIMDYYEGKDNNPAEDPDKPRPLDYKDDSTQAEMTALQEELSALAASVAILQDQYYTSLEKLDEEIADRELKKNQEEYVEKFLQGVLARRNKHNYKYTERDLEEFLECFNCLRGSSKWIEEKADYVNQVFKESGQYAELQNIKFRFESALRSMEEAVSPPETSKSYPDQPSNWDINLINQRLSALEEENLQLASEVELLNYKVKESSAIQGMMIRWFFLLSQGEKFNYADLLEVLNNRDIRNPKEEEPLNASFLRTQEAEQIYQNSLEIPKVIEQKKFVLAQVWDAISSHNQKCELYEDLAPICPWLPVVRAVVNHYFLDVGRRVLQGSLADNKQQSFLAAHHFFKNYNPQEFCLSENDSRRLIEDWKFSYTKKIGLKPSVQKKIDSTFSSTDFCPKRLADSERDAIIKTSAQGIVQLFGDSCEIRLRSEILSGITEGKL